MQNPARLNATLKICVSGVQFSEVAKQLFVSLYNTMTYKARYRIDRHKYCQNKIIVVYYEHGKTAESEIGEALPIVVIYSDLFCRADAELAV